jgi:hypothetical protein
MTMERKAPELPTPMKCKSFRPTYQETKWLVAIIIFLDILMLALVIYIGFLFYYA